MTIIAWLVVGAIAGYVANYVLGTRQGLITTIAFGILGAVVGGLIGSFAAGQGLDLSYLMSNFNLLSIIVAVLGAIAAGGLGIWWTKRQSA